VEGVLALCMVTAGTMVAVSFLVNSGMMIYYKNKLGFISSQVALQAANKPQMEDMEVEQMAKDLLTQMGLPTKDLKVTRKAVSIYGRPAVKVIIENGRMPLFSNIDFLPATIGVQDSATAIISPYPSGADAYYMPRGRISGYVVPLVRIPAGGPRFGDMPLLAN
jgi:hypothetical protein